jgi:hypothetical protein
MGTNLNFSGLTYLEGHESPLGKSDTPIPSCSYTSVSMMKIGRIWVSGTQEVHKKFLSGKLHGRYRCEWDDDINVK